jgi:hypothetical protein
MIRTGTAGTRETDLWSNPGSVLLKLGHYPNPLPIASFEQNVYDILVGRIARRC